MPWRYGLFLALFVCGQLVHLRLPWFHATMAAFDVAALGYCLTLPSLFRDDADSMRDRVRRNDANLALMLALTGIVMLVILASVGEEFVLKAMDSKASVAFTIFTLMLAWMFSNFIYALHYAHMFYQQSDKGDRGGLKFPATPDPHYWDFVYFAFGLGMAFQTADVEITDTRFRIAATCHTIAAFVFNIGVVAVSINILAS